MEALYPGLGVETDDWISPHVHFSVEDVMAGSGTKRVKVTVAEAGVERTFDTEVGPRGATALVTGDHVRPALREGQLETLLQLAGLEPMGDGAVLPPADRGVALAVRRKMGDETEDGCITAEMRLFMIPAAEHAKLVAGTAALVSAELVPSTYTGLPMVPEGAVVTMGPAVPLSQVLSEHGDD